MNTDLPKYYCKRSTNAIKHQNWKPVTDRFQILFTMFRDEHLSPSQVEVLTEILQPPCLVVENSIASTRISSSSPIIGKRPEYYNNMVDCSWREDYVNEILENKYSPSHLHQFPSPKVSKPAINMKPEEHWTPFDDWIEVDLYTFQDKYPRNWEEVDAHIDNILYGPTTGKRLPVFTQFCPPGHVQGSDECNLSWIDELLDDKYIPEYEDADWGKIFSPAFIPAIDEKMEYAVSGNGDTEDQDSMLNDKKIELSTTGDDRNKKVEDSMLTDDSDSFLNLEA